MGSAGSVLVGRVLVVGLGMGALLLWADGRAVGFTSNTRGPPVGGAAASSCFGVGVCWVRPFRRDPSLIGGLWWLWWVVCDLYSGCEHLCCLRASPFFVLSCACAWGVGGRVARGAAVLWWWSWACFLLCVVLWGIRWMPWHQELMKDVAACDMPRGAGERALLSEGVRMGEPNLGCAGLPSSERV